MYFKKLVVLVWAAGLCSAPACAQIKINNFSKALQAAVGRQTALEAAARQAVYHPVFGYVRPLPAVAALELKPVSAFELQPPFDLYEARPVQVAPMLQVADEVRRTEAFVRFEWLLPGQLTQAFYLWRLGHTQFPLVRGGYYDFLVQQAQRVYREHMLPGHLTAVDELPNLLFLKRLADPAFTPLSYAQLLRRTAVYPKHVTLSAYGFPVKTPQADQATLLDTYLMLAHPAAMGTFNNTAEWKSRRHGYRPFVLTKEEQAAAEKLLELRRQAERLPAKATARDLLALAYNRLETHTIPYTQVDEAGAGYKAYPNYRNTRLYHTIKAQLNGQMPLQVYDHGHYTLYNMDTAHLIVLNAVMGGMDIADLDEAARVLQAFEALCAEIRPSDKPNIDHVSVLQKNLRVVFEPLLSFYRQTLSQEGDSPADSHKAWLAQKAWRLLAARPVRSLVGQNWQRH